MDFVDEQNGRLAFVGETVCRAGKHAPHVGDIRFHAAEPLELAARLPRDNLRQRSLARARWSVKDQRLDAVGLNGAPEQLAGTENVRLPDVFVQVTGTHARSQRRVRSGRRLGWFSGGNLR